MSEFITPEVNIPQRNISQELQQMFNFQRQYAGPYYDLNSTYGPQYNRLDIRNLGDQVLGFDDNGTHVPGTAELGRAGADYAREGDISAVERLGGRASAAELAAKPWLVRSLNELDRRKADTPLLRMLNQQAEGDLASNGYLSPEAERGIRETTRSAWADRGLGHTDQSAIDELMNREALRSGRVLAARKFAGDVEGLNQTMRDYLGRVAQIEGTVLPDTFSEVLSRSSGTGPGSGAGLTPIGSNTKPFDPFNPYFQDYFSSNQSAAGTEAVANAQAQANTRTAIASIAGGFIGSDIRLKEKIREVGIHSIPTIYSHPRPVIPIVEFEYRAGCVPQGLRPTRYRGVLAQDVEEIMAAAVRTNARGFKEVDYAMIGLEFKEAP